MNKLRKIEIKNNNDTWKEVHFSELEKGDTFRMFEPDSEPVIDLNLRTDFLATSDVYVDEITKESMINIEE
jgi:hypothetical protein